MKHAYTALWPRIIDGIIHRLRGRDAVWAWSDGSPYNGGALRLFIRSSSGVLSEASTYWPGWVYFRLCALRDWYFKLQLKAMGGIFNPDLEAQLDEALKESADFETFKRLRRLHKEAS